MAFVARIRSQPLRRFSTILAPDGSAPLTSKQKSRAALALLKSETDPSRIVEICRAASLSPESHLDRVALSVAVSKLSPSPDSVRSLLSFLPDTPRSTSHAIVLSGQAGLLDDALILFRRLPPPVPASSLNSLLFACLLSHRHDDLLRIFREFPRLYSIQPNLDTYNTVLKSLSESSQSRSSFALLDEMDRKGIKPNATSFNTLLAGLYRDGHFADVSRALDLMKKHDFHAGISTHNVRIQSLCKAGRTGEAKALFDGLLARGVKPNSVTYYHLIYGFCKGGDLEEAKRLFDDMGKKECVPDSSCYFTLCYYLCKGGDFESGLRVCRESIAKEWVPNFTTMKMLVDGLVGMSKVEEARELLGKIKERFPNRVDMWKVVEESLPQ